MIYAQGGCRSRCKKRRIGKTGSGRIGIRASGAGGAQRPIQIKAQVLRDRPAASGGTLGFVLPADPPCGEGAEPRWSDADVERAIAAAERAGLAAYRIEIGPDGTIAIVVGGSGSEEPA